MINRNRNAIGLLIERSAGTVAIDERIKRPTVALQPGGFITGTATEMDVRGLGRINSLDDVANIVVTVRDGVPVRIRDVADVRDGSAVRRGIARVNEQEAVVMTVTKQFGSD